MKNYRIEFLFPKANQKFQAEYYNDFEKVAGKYYTIASKIRHLMVFTGGRSHSSYPPIWYFYEPHVEITWFYDEKEEFHEALAEALFDEVEKYLDRQGIHDYKRKYPKDGDFADWYCTSDKEREFGAKRYALCSDFVDLYNEYKDAVDSGKGLRKQVERTIHGLCNPLGINYKTEAKLCFSRGLICLLFCFFSFERAVWIYRNIFRQIY